MGSNTNRCGFGRSSGSEKIEDEDVIVVGWWKTLKAFM